MSKEFIAPKPSGGVLEVLPPFPIVLVTTRSNVITVNQIAYFTFSPLRIGIGIAHTRHTYSLLKDEREFVINIPDASLVDAVKTCGSLSGRDHHKFKAAGLSAQESSQVSAVSIRECSANIECRVVKEIAFEERTWFIGEVVAARKGEGHLGTKALLCDRQHYVVSGTAVAPR